MVRQCLLLCEVVTEHTAPSLEDQVLIMISCRRAGLSDKHMLLCCELKPANVCKIPFKPSCLSCKTLIDSKIPNHTLDQMLVCICYVAPLLSQNPATTPSSCLEQEFQKQQSLPSPTSPPHPKPAHLNPCPSQLVEYFLPVSKDHTCEVSGKRAQGPDV